MSWRPPPQWGQPSSLADRQPPPTFSSAPPSRSLGRNDSLPFDTQFGFDDYELASPRDRSDWMSNRPMTPYSDSSEDMTRSGPSSRTSPDFEQSTFEQVERQSRSRYRGSYLDGHYPTRSSSSERYLPPDTNDPMTSGPSWTSPPTALSYPIRPLGSATTAPQPINSRPRNSVMSDAALFSPPPSSSMQYRDRNGSVGQPQAPPERVNRFGRVSGSNMRTVDTREGSRPPLAPTVESWRSSVASGAAYADPMRGPSPDLWTDQQGFPSGGLAPLPPPMLPPNPMPMSSRRMSMGQAPLPNRQSSPLPIGRPSMGADMSGLDLDMSALALSPRGAFHNPVPPLPSIFQTNSSRGGAPAYGSSNRSRYSDGDAGAGYRH